MTNATTTGAPARTAAEHGGRTYRSETAKHRHVLGPLCQGCGIDVGFGGDPITPTAMRMDLPQPYARTGDALPVQLPGDCRDLLWFRSDVLDYVYSSHVLEDFDREQTAPILGEWARVLRPGGCMVLLQPDQARYVASCRRRGIAPNAHHSIDDFSLHYVVRAAEQVGELEVAADYPELDEYSFAVVFRKTSATGERDGHDAQARLVQAWHERDELSFRVRKLESRIGALEKSRALRASRAIRRLFGL